MELPVWGVIAEHGKELSANGNSQMYEYRGKNYRITWPHDWPNYELTEDNKGNIFEISGDLKHPYVEFCDKDDRPEAMSV